MSAQSSIIGSPVAGAGLLLATALFWGGQYPIVKTALHAIDPVWVTLIRYGFAVPVLLAVLAMAEGRPALSFEGRFRRAAGLGVLGFWGFSVLTLVGLGMAPPEHVALIVALLPMSTALLGWAGGGRAPSAATLLCLVLALAGVALLVTGGRGLRGMDRAAVLGDAIVLVGMLGWSRYTLSIASFTGWSALRVTALTCAAAFPLGLLLTLGLLAAGALSLPEPGALWQHRGALAYTAFFATAAAMLCWNLGIRAVGPVNGSLFMNLVPVVTFAFAISAGRMPAPAELGGAALVLAGLLLNNLALRRAA